MESFHDLIHRVFPMGSPPPGPLTGHRCQECDEVDDILGAMTWPEVAAEFPQYCHDAYPLLTLEAKIYFLPAWMIASVAEHSGLQGTSLECELGQCSLPRDRFTADQRGAILRWEKEYFVRLMETEPSPEFNNYWSAPDS